MKLGKYYKKNQIIKTKTTNNINLATKGDYNSMVEAIKKIVNIFTLL